MLDISFATHILSKIGIKIYINQENKGGVKEKEKLN